MTGISAIAPIAICRSNLRRLDILTLRIGASLAAISALLGDAFKMAYVDPYTSRSRRLLVVPDDELEGRDPDW